MIEHLLNQTITLATRATVGDGGASTYNTATTYAARVEASRKKVLGKDGKELISNARILLNSTVTVNTTDKLVLPDGSTPEIIEVKPNVDGRGINQYWTVIV